MDLLFMFAGLVMLGMPTMLIVLGTDKKRRWRLVWLTLGLAWAACDVLIVLNVMKNGLDLP